MPQALEKADCQPAWRVRHLLSLALCQGSEEGKPDDVAKTLAKALELATSANLQQLRVSHAGLGRQTHNLHTSGLNRCCDLIAIITQYGVFLMHTHPNKLV
jgi:hypothetical protein